VLLTCCVWSIALAVKFGWNKMQPFITICVIQYLHKVLRYHYWHGCFDFLCSGALFDVWGRKKRNDSSTAMVKCIFYNVVETTTYYLLIHASSTCKYLPNMMLIIQYSQYIECSNFVNRWHLTSPLSFFWIFSSYSLKFFNFFRFFKNI